MSEIFVVLAVIAAAQFCPRFLACAIIKMEVAWISSNNRSAALALINAGKLRGGQGADWQSSTAAERRLLRYGLDDAVSTVMIQSLFPFIALESETS